MNRYVKCIQWSGGMFKSGSWYELDRVNDSVIDGTGKSSILVTQASHPFNFDWEGMVEAPELPVEAMEAPKPSQRKPVNKRPRLSAPNAELMYHLMEQTTGETFHQKLSIVLNKAKIHDVLAEQNLSMHEDVLRAEAEKKEIVKDIDTLEAIYANESVFYRKLVPMVAIISGVLGLIGGGLL